MVEPTSKVDVVAELVAVQRPLLGYILALIPSLADAEDVLQSTNATVLRKREEFSEVQDFASWVRRVAYYEALEWRRRSARDRRVLLMDDTLFDQLASDASEQSCRQASQQADIFLALEECEQALAVSDRNILAMRYRDGENIEGISAATGRSVTAVRQVLYRIRVGLLSCIERRLAAKVGRV